MKTKLLWKIQVWANHFNSNCHSHLVYSSSIYKSRQIDVGWNNKNWNNNTFMVEIRKDTISSLTQVPFFLMVNESMLPADIRFLCDFRISRLLSSGISYRGKEHFKLHENIEQLQSTVQSVVSIWISRITIDSLLFCPFSSAMLFILFIFIIPSFCIPSLQIFYFQQIISVKYFKSICEVEFFNLYHLINNKQFPTKIVRHFSQFCYAAGVPIKFKGRLL